MVGQDLRGETTMITTEAALYGAARAGAALLDHAAQAAQATEPLTTCGCGQELAGVRRQHCPRCGCCLN